METKSSPVAKAEMLIRKPITDVFEAFVDPAITTKFWFTRSSGRLDKNAKVEWTWEMYNYTAAVDVRKIEPPSRIRIDWGDDNEKTTVEWTFRSIESDSTFVSIVNSGFKGDMDSIISQVRDSTEGFSLVLAGLKAWFEHGIQLNLIGDRFPGGIPG